VSLTDEIRCRGSVFRQHFAATSAPVRLYDWILLNPEMAPCNLSNTPRAIVDLIRSQQYARHDRNVRSFCRRRPRDSTFAKPPLHHDHRLAKKNPPTPGEKRWKSGRKALLTTPIPLLALRGKSTAGRKRWSLALMSGRTSHSLQRCRIRLCANSTAEPTLRDEP